MQRVETSLPGVFELRPAIHRDARGFFIETYHKAKFDDIGMTCSHRAGLLVESHTHREFDLVYEGPPRPAGRVSLCLTLIHGLLCGTPAGISAGA